MSFRYGFYVTVRDFLLKEKRIFGFFQTKGLAVEAAFLGSELCKLESECVILRPNFNETDIDNNKLFREWRSYNGSFFKEIRCFYTNSSSYDLVYEVCVPALPDVPFNTFDYNKLLARDISELEIFKQKAYQTFK